MAVAEQHLTQRRAEIEAWLDERRVKWEFIDQLPVDQIDRIASLGNQARLDPLSEEVVDRYAADMERGDLFPPIVVRRSGKRLILIGGNHRTAAAERTQRAALPAYVIDVEPEMAVRLTYEDNRRHGLPPSEEERIYQAVHLVNNGYTQTAAADTVGVSAKKLAQAIGAARADRRAAEHRIKGWERIPKSVRWRIDQLRSDPVFAAAAQLVCDTNMATSDSFVLITKLNNTRSEADALTVIDLEAQQRAGQAQRSAGGVIRKATPRSRLLTALGTIAGLNGGDIAASCATPDQRAQLKRQVRSTITALEAVAKEL